MRCVIRSCYCISLVSFIMAIGGTRRQLEPDPDLNESQVRIAAETLLGVTPPSEGRTVVRPKINPVVLPTTPLITLNTPAWVCRFENVEFRTKNVLPQLVGTFDVEVVLEDPTLRVVSIRLHKRGAAAVPELADPACFQRQLAANGPEVWTDLLSGPPRMTLGEVFLAACAMPGGLSTASDITVHVVLGKRGLVQTEAVPIWSLYAQGIDESAATIRLQEDMKAAAPENRDAYTFIRYVVRDDIRAAVSITNHPVPKKYSAAWCPSGDAKPMPKDADALPARHSAPNQKPEKIK
jgi:hypothetical protein